MWLNVFKYVIFMMGIFFDEVSVWSVIRVLIVFMGLGGGKGNFWE